MPLISYFFVHLFRSSSPLFTAFFPVPYLIYVRTSFRVPLCYEVDEVDLSLDWCEENLKSFHKIRIFEENGQRSSH